MKNFLFVFAIFLCSCLPRAKPADCVQFKNGKFQSKINGHRYIIERDGQTQKEYIFAAKDTVTAVLSVKWIDDCTYTLTPDEQTRIKSKSPKNAMVTVHIISTSENSYIQRATTNFDDRVYTSEFVRIK